MATITTILASDIIASSRVTLNTNFANLNTDKVDINSTYADPAWITSLAGAKITGNIGGNAATATALATARTIAGVSFDGTANIAIPSTGLSDSSDIVRGASSVASGQVLYGTGAGVAGSEAALFWDSANNRLGVGTNTPADLAQFESASGVQARLTIVAGATAQSPGLQLGWPGNTNAGIIRVDLAGANGGDLSIWAKATGSSVAEKMRVFGSGNVGIGTTADDGTNRLQVAGSVYTTGPLRADNNDNFFGNLTTGTFLNLGSLGDASNAWIDARGTGTNVGLTMRVKGSGSFTFTSPTHGLATLAADGTFTVRNQTPTTGVTQVIVRAGAGQSTTPVQQWQLSSGSARLLVTDTLGIQARGTFFAVQDSGGTINRAIVQSTMDVNSSYSFNFSSTTDATGTKDLSLSRASGNTLQVGDGGSNANGGLFASSIGVGVTPSIAANVNQVIIRAGSAQSTTNLTTWQNSSGTTLAAIGSTGRMFSPRFTTLVDSGWALQDDFDSSWPMLFASGRGIAWSSTTSFAGSKDISLSRAGVNIGQFGDGGSNSNGLLYLKGVRPVGSTVANLPTASGNTGMMATVTDATVTTIGTTVAGGGGNTVLVWSNGTNWRIYAN
jgi:hypothetical protein